MNRTMRTALAGTAITALWAAPVWAADSTDSDRAGDEIVVTGLLADQAASGKTDVPLIETPQPITIVSAETFRAQGAISISDTLRYVAGVTSNAYGRDTRVDGAIVRGVDPLQFRDGMRDIFSYYASITSDPYNFSRVELVRGPASVLFGQGSIGGIFNMVSKTPDFETHGEAQIVYGSFDRKEAMADITGPLSDTLAVRLVGRVRDADTQTDHVPDDRMMFAPSLRWRPGENTDVTLIGLYQEDDSGSTAQFLPVVGSLYENPGKPRFPNSLFIGKPGWDRYDGRLLQGSALVTHNISDALKLSFKARYIDSDLDYFTHYPDSYSNPSDPYIPGSNGRIIGLYSDASVARMNVFSTDNNAQFKFNTGAAIEHTVLAGVDYSWNKVTKRGGFGYELIDIYDIDYAALTIPEIADTGSRDSQKQLGFYVQDQIRIWDRVSMVFGARRDHVKSRSIGVDDTTDNATTFRAGIIGEIGAGVSPFFSYTESFLPISGLTGNNTPFKPQRGVQYEAGVKWQPNAATLVTITAFDITEQNRPIADPNNPLERIQAGRLKTRGVEFEATRTLPGNFDLIVNYGYNKVRIDDAAAFDYLPRHNASIWTTKTFAMAEATSLRLGTGVRYTGKSQSTGSWTIVTPDYTLVDALAAITWDKWSFAVNATNLFNKKFYASCLARGDCFIGAERNVMGTLAFRF